MAHYVKIASVLFQTEARKGAKDAKPTVLRETAQTLNALQGYGLDLVVFCEGVESFGQQVEDAEEIARPGPFLGLYAAFAESEQCFVAGSVKLRDQGKVYNSIAFVAPDGRASAAYHKNNLTIGELEAGMSSGSGATVVDTPIGRLGGIVCFDLNFESIRKKYRALKPDILAFASMYHGGLMQPLWAYECQSYFVSALPFMGGGILDPFGTPLALTDHYTPVAVATVNLDRAMVHLDYNREKFPDIRRRYLDEVEVRIPPNLGPALIVSHSEKRSAADVVKEFELELLDDYFARSIEANARDRGA